MDWINEPPINQRDDREVIVGAFRDHIVSVLWMLIVRETRQFHHAYSMPRCMYILVYR